MEQDIATEEQMQPSGCANCGHLIVEPGYPTQLCMECRTRFIKYPIPISIRIFAAAIGVVLVFAMITVPANFSATIHYQRGKKAVKQGNYFTAQQELEKTLKAVPGFDKAKEYMAIASFYNTDIGRFAVIIGELEGKIVSDEGLYSEIKILIDKAASYLPSDSFNTLMNQFDSLTEIRDEVYEKYTALHPQEIFPSLKLASARFDKEKYASCDSLLNRVLEQDGSYLGVLYMKTSVKRQLHQYDSAHYYCEKALSLNRQSTYAISSKARTFLGQHKDTEGLQWAQKAVAIDPADPYSIATLALAYHFNNRVAERDKLLRTGTKDPAMMTTMKFVRDVIEGKEKFRD